MTRHATILADRLAEIGWTTYRLSQLGADHGGPLSCHSQTVYKVVRGDVSPSVDLWLELLGAVGLTVKIKKGKAP